LKLEEGGTWYRRRKLGTGKEEALAFVRKGTFHLIIVWGGGGGGKGRIGVFILVALWEGGEGVLQRGVPLCQVRLRGKRFADGH